MGPSARSLVLVAASIVSLVGRAEAGPPGEPPASRRGLPGPEEVIASEADLWGEAALRQPGGPTYDFFADLLPPLALRGRRLPPLPDRPQRPRLARQGPAGQQRQRHQRPGPAAQLEERDRHPGPRPRRPGPRAVRCRPGSPRRPALRRRIPADRPAPLRRTTARATARRRSPPWTETLAAAGTALVRFDFPAQDRGQIDLRFEYGSELLTARDGTIRDTAGKVLAAYDDNWEWNPSRSLLISKAEHAPTAASAIFTRPIDAASARGRGWTSTAGSATCASAAGATCWPPA